MSAIFPGLKKRLDPPNLVVLHHTAGEGNAEQVIRTLKQRKSAKAPNGLSIHFIVDQLGKVVQCADLDEICLHAGPRANRRSVGVEIANRGRPPHHPKFPRNEERHTIHGRTVKSLGFYPAQLESVLDILNQIFRAVPSMKRNVALERRVLTDLELDAYGVIGHYNLTRKKVDPVPSLMEYVSANL